MDRLKLIYDEIGKLDADSKKLLEVPDGQLVAKDKLEQWDAMDARITALQGEAQRLEAQARRGEELSRARPRLAGNPDPSPEPRGGEDGDEPLSNLSAGKPDGLTLHFPKRKFPGSRYAVIKPGSGLHNRLKASYANEFGQYAASNGLRVGALMQVNQADKGGYLAPTTMVNELIQAVDDMVFMRQISRVIPMAGYASLGVPTLDTKPSDAAWTEEVLTTDITADTATAFGKRNFEPHLLTKVFDVSEKMLRTSVIDVMSFLAERAAYTIAVPEENGFLSGTGAAPQPLGIFTASAAGVPTSSDVTASATTSFSADDLINMFYQLKGQYTGSPNCAWIMSRAAVKMARKLKDGNGQYLLSMPGLQTGPVPTILEKPVYQSEFAPSTFTTGLYVAVLGDFRFYWIADSLDIQIRMLDQTKALQNKVQVKVQKETDGMPVLGEAFARLKLA